MPEVLIKKQPAPKLSLFVGDGPERQELEISAIKQNV